MSNTPLRNRICDRHPAITFDGRYRLLKDAERLRDTDETVCVSTLLSLAGDKWSSVMPEWKDDIDKKVAEILGPDSDDADAQERLFRRLI